MARAEVKHRGFAFGALLAPSGAALTMSNVNLGVHLVSDCALTMYALG
jgi:hypothetical protein